MNVCSIVKARAHSKSELLSLPPPSLSPSLCSALCLSYFLIFTELINTNYGINFHSICRITCTVHRSRACSGGRRYDPSHTHQVGMFRPPGGVLGSDPPLCHSLASRDTRRTPYSVTGSTSASLCLSRLYIPTRDNPTGCGSVMPLV